VPVNDKMFEKMNDAQVVWYQIQFALDEKEKFELLRDVAEHNAMFMNPDGVNKIREARENTFAVPDEKFDKFIQEQFGRSVPKKQDKNVDFKELFKREEQNKEKLNTYLNMDLDEIKFVPM
jgi:hypothetical protein